MSSQVVSPRQTIPLYLTVSAAGVGGVAGQSPTVELRRLSDGFYLDFGDNVFKNSGWVTRKAPLTGLGGGAYLRSLNLGTINAKAGDTFLALYELTGAYAGVSSDTFNVEDLELMRQIIDNRMEEVAGDPGTVTLYDDDGVTPRRSWAIRDYTGGAVLASTGAPARRGAGT